MPPDQIKRRHLRKATDELPIERPTQAVLVREMRHGRVEPITCPKNCLDVLAQQVGIRGMFSDWPATTTFYASCTGMK